MTLQTNTCVELFVLVLEPDRDGPATFIAQFMRKWHARDKR